MQPLTTPPPPHTHTQESDPAALDNEAVVELSAGLAALGALVHRLGPFLSPYLSRALPALLHPATLAHCGGAAAGVRGALPPAVPARLLLTPLFGALPYAMVGVEAELNWDWGNVGVCALPALLHPATLALCGGWLRVCLCACCSRRGDGVLLFTTVGGLCFDCSMGNSSSQYVRQSPCLLGVERVGGMYCLGPGRRSWAAQAAQVKPTGCPTLGHVMNLVCT